MRTHENQVKKQSRGNAAMFFSVVVELCIVCLAVPTHVVLAQGSQAQQVQESTEVFILRQLIEMQNELQGLRKEMTDLREIVDELQVDAEPPEDTSARLTTITLDQDDPVLGDLTATVAIVEFTDYECPFCKSHHTQTFPQLKKEFIDTGKVQYIVRDFPLAFHSEAKAAAVAANCAGQQGAYWKMNDVLYSKQAELGEELYRQSAQSLELDMDQFLTCVNLDDQKEEVLADLTYGRQIGINGTPTFFVGRIQEGQLVEVKEIGGAQGLEVFSAIIDPLLNK